jgi:sulfite exporter TauE/SafE
MLADCLHGLTALGDGGLAALLGAMLLAGLASGATHCAGMCGPFVMAQMASGAAHGGGVLRRLSGAALLPYQAGRALGYTTLGAVAGGAGALTGTLAPRGLLALPLGLAALAMLAQGVARLGGPSLAARLPRFGGTLPLGRATRLLAGPQTAGRGFALGLLLSALPCGLLYGALAAAAGAGSALAGALAMLAFVLGTMPALIGVALLGRFFGRRCGPWLGRVAGLLLLVNGGVLALLALRAAA